MNLDYLREMYTVTVRGDKLHFHPTPEPEMQAKIRPHKAELLETLRIEATTSVKDIAAALVRSGYYSGDEELPQYPGDFAPRLHDVGWLPFEPTNAQMLVACTKLRLDHLMATKKRKATRKRILRELDDVHKPGGQALKKAEALVQEETR